MRYDYHNNRLCTGKNVKEVLGIATGNVVRAKNIGKYILAGLRNLVGGEIREYTELLKDSRDEALQRMIKSAEALGADAIINMRFVTSSVMQGGQLNCLHTVR